MPLTRHLKSGYPPVGSRYGIYGNTYCSSDEQNKKIGEMSWNDIETMLSGFAYDVYCNRNETSKKNYFTVFDYAIDQDLPLVAVWEPIIIMVIRYVRYIRRHG